MIQALLVLAAAFLPQNSANSPNLLPPANAAVMPAPSAETASNVQSGWEFNNKSKKYEFTIQIPPETLRDFAAGSTGSELKVDIPPDVLRYVQTVVVRFGNSPLVQSPPSVEFKTAMDSDNFTAIAKLNETSLSNIDPQIVLTSGQSSGSVLPPGLPGTTGGTNSSRSTSNPGDLTLPPTGSASSPTGGSSTLPTSGSTSAPGYVAPTESTNSNSISSSNPGGYGPGGMSSGGLNIPNSPDNRPSMGGIPSTGGAAGGNLPSGPTSSFPSTSSQNTNGSTGSSPSIGSPTGYNPSTAFTGGVPIEGYGPSPRPNGSNNNAMTGAGNAQVPYGVPSNYNLPAGHSPSSFMPVGNFPAANNGNPGAISGYLQPHNNPQSGYLTPTGNQNQQFPMPKTGGITPNPNVESRLAGMGGASGGADRTSSPNLGGGTGSNVGAGVGYPLFNEGSGIDGGADSAPGVTLDRLLPMITLLLLVINIYQFFWMAHVRTRYKEMVVSKRNAQLHLSNS